MSGRPRVSIHSIQERLDGRRKPLLVRWTVNGEPFSEAFSGKKGADRYRADLIRADADGVRFDVRTGRPVAWEEREEIDLASWARRWLGQQWSRLEPKTRKTTGEALRWMVERSVRPGSMPITAEMHKELMEWLCDPAVVATGDLRRWLERAVPMVSTMDGPALYELDRRLRLRVDGVSPLGARAANRQVAIAKRCLRNSVKAGLLEGPLAWPEPETGESTLKINRVDVYVIAPLQLEQARAVLRHLVSHQPGSKRYQVATAVGFFAGLRPGETVTLEVQDLELPEDGWGSILVTRAWTGAGDQWGDADQDIGLPKTRDRTVPIPPELVVILRTYLDDMAITEGPIFETANGGRPTPSNWARALRRACLAAKVPVISPYDTRHCAVSWWSSLGVPIAESARRAGHSAQVALKYYTHPMENDVERSNSLLEGFYDE